MVLTLVLCLCGMGTATTTLYPLPEFCGAEGFARAATRPGSPKASIATRLLHGDVTGHLVLTRRERTPNTRPARGFSGNMTMLDMSTSLHPYIHTFHARLQLL